MTNHNGKNFEQKTDNEHNLSQNGYKMLPLRKGYYLEFDDVIFLKQNSFKIYSFQFFNIKMFRYPDECYIIKNKDKITIKILEKKNQNRSGSVETKLWAGPSLKREYELVFGEKFDISYGFCVNDYLKKLLYSNKQKYNLLLQILDENNIDVLFGEDSDYFDNLNKWIRN